MNKDAIIKLCGIEFTNYILDGGIEVLLGRFINGDKKDCEYNKSEICYKKNEILDFYQDIMFQNSTLVKEIFRYLDVLVDAVTIHNDNLSEMQCISLSLEQNQNKMVMRITCLFDNKLIERPDYWQISEQLIPCFDEKVLEKHIVYSVISEEINGSSGLFVIELGRKIKKSYGFVRFARDLDAGEDEYFDGSNGENILILRIRRKL